MYLVPRRRAERRRHQGRAGPDAEPAVRLRPAGHRLRRPGRDARRRRHRRRRRRREHEPSGLSGVRDALGRTHGRQRDDRHDDRRAARPVREHPHGHHRREPGRDAIRSPAASRTNSRSQSHQRAARAIKEGRFKTPDPAGHAEVAQRRDRSSTPTSMSAPTPRPRISPSCAPVFKKDGTVTAGNASGINDGAAAVVLMDGDTVAKRGAKPLGRLVAYAHAGVDPKIMGIGPVPATRAALKRAGLTLDQMDVIESNEAFAAQACAVAKDLGFDPEKTNPNGSGISLGHPVGATGHDPDGQGAVRTGADRRSLCAGDDVHRRRPGDRGDLRTGALTRSDACRERNHGAPWRRGSDYQPVMARLDRAIPGQ